MPKVTLTFKLPEEREDFEYASKGLEYKIVIDEIDEYLRKMIKYETLTDEAANIYQEVRDKLWEIKRDQSE